MPKICYTLPTPREVDGYVISPTFHCLGSGPYWLNANWQSNAFETNTVSLLEIGIPSHRTL